MSAHAVPTSGVARRRIKAINRRRHVEARVNGRLVAAGNLPAHFTALDTCPCGWVQWLEEGATVEDRVDFFQASNDHAAYCDGGAA